MVIGAFTTLFQQKLIFGLQWIFAERRGEKAEFFVPGGPSSSTTEDLFFLVQKQLMITTTCLLLGVTRNPINFGRIHSVPAIRYPYLGTHEKRFRTTRRSHNLRWNKSKRNTITHVSLLSLLLLGLNKPSETGRTRLVPA